MKNKTKIKIQKCWVEWTQSLDIWLYRLKSPKPSGQVQYDWQLAEMSGMEIAGVWITAEVSKTEMCKSLEKECGEREMVFWHSRNFLDSVYHIK